jgi:rRNA maturation endonuclease Nob1
MNISPFLEWRYFNTGRRKNKDNKNIGEMEDSKDSRHSGLECPQCGELSHLMWILNKNHGFCTSCGHTWPIKISS